MGARVTDRHGGALLIRDVSPADIVAVDELLVGLSRDSAYQRFMAVATRAQAEGYSRTLVDPARTQDAVVAEAQGRLVGVASTHLLPDGSAEFAIAVDDRRQHDGLGTLLLEALVERAERRGVHTLVGLVLSTNTQMLRVIHDLGLPYRTVPEGSVVSVLLTIDATAEYARAQQSRASAAASGAAP